MGMGTGKTKVCIDWAAAEALRLDQRAPAIRALVCCPLSVVGVWPKEIAKHDPFADNDFMGVEWRIINYDKVWRPHVYDELVEWLCEVTPDRRLVICDESHKIKTYSARRSKAMHRLGKYTDKKVIGSGTPHTKTPLDFFSQFKFLDVSIFGDRIEGFKRMVVIQSPWTPKLVIKPFVERWIWKKTGHLVFRIKKEECLDLPPKTHELVPVFLEPKARKVYDELCYQAITEFEAEWFEAEHVLTRMLRLQQLTGGWLKNEKGYRKISTAKLEVFRDLLETLEANERKKVVVFCHFRRELAEIRKVTKAVGYKVLTVHGGNRKRRERIYTAFEETDKPTVLVCQLATGAEGRNELVVAHEAIFFSHDFSFVHFDQALDRLHRPGQRNKVTYYHLVVEDSLDSTVLLALREKRQLAELVLKYPSLLRSSSDTTKLEEA